MVEAPGGEHVGLFSALKRIAATLLASGKTRLELIANEIEAGKLRAIQMLVMALAMAFCLGVGILLAVALLVALFWERRLLILGLSMAVFRVVGGVLAARLQEAARRPQKLFAASIAELEEDLRQLKEAGHEPPAR